MSKKWNRKTACLLICLAVGARHSTAQPAAPFLQKKIVGYYVSWGMYDEHKNYQPRQIPWTKLTHINYAFAAIKPGSWEILSTDPWADHQVNGRGQIGQINSLKVRYGVKTLISIGGWTRSGMFSEMAATETGRKTFARECVRYIRRYGFDGVDIDWEYPGYFREPDPGVPGDEGCPGRPEDQQNFTLLLKELRQTLDAAGREEDRRYLLTIAAPAGYDKVEGPTAVQAPEEYHRYLDWLNIMTYDFHGEWDPLTAHHTALYGNPADPYGRSPVNIKEGYNVDAVMRYYRDVCHVPAEKMNLGAAYYARTWNNVENGGTGGLFQSGEGRSINERFFELKKYETKGSYQYGYDTKAAAPYLYNPRKKIFFSYDNERSIAEKCDYALANGYGGMFFWELSSDYHAGGGDTLTAVIYGRFSTAESSDSDR